MNLDVVTRHQEIAPICAKVFQPGRSSRASLAMSLGMLLLSASLLKVWAYARYPVPPDRVWVDGPVTVASVAGFEAAFAAVLVGGLWKRVAWYASLATFGLFAVVTAVETIKGDSSCGCFGAVQVRPIYTLSLDIAAVLLLLTTGRPNGKAEVGGRRSEGRVGRCIFAAAIAVIWVGTVLGFWMTRPAIAVAADQDFGKAGELVVLEPEKWTGQRFSLAEHIDAGAQINSGRWIVLLVHHDCDHCAAAVPRYVAEYPSRLPPTPNLLPPPRLAVVEMPPFADANDPPPWQLPSSVLSGHLDTSRDWFATTPVAIELRDGIIRSAKEGDAAQTPSPQIGENEHQ